MTWARRLAPLAAVTLALGVALLLAPGATATWTHVYLVLVAAGVVTATVRTLAGRHEAQKASMLEDALRRRAEPSGRPEDLETLERLVSIGSASAFDLYYRLRPALREIAAGVLLGRGVDLENQPERARAALGDKAWSILRPDLEPPQDRHTRTLAVADLEAVVLGIERAR